MTDDLPDLFAATKQGRIGAFPFDPRFPVQSFWDLGRNDLNTIWLHQHVGGHDRFVGYYENSGEFIGHYVARLKEWGASGGPRLAGTSSRMMATARACGSRTGPRA